MPGAMEGGLHLLFAQKHCTGLYLNAVAGLCIDYLLKTHKKLPVVVTSRKGKGWRGNQGQEHNFPQYTFPFKPLGI